VIGILIGGAVVFRNIQGTFYFDPSDANSVSDYIESRSAMGDSFGADRSITEGSFPVKVVYLWTRPFFLDAENMMGYVASLENIVLLFMIGYLLTNFRSVLAVSKKVLYIRYAIAMFITTTVLLAAVNYNVGLGLRQKMMAIPPLFTIFITLIALKIASRRQAAELPGPVFQPGQALPARAYAATSFVQR
jgi:hypothetical protein